MLACEPVRGLLEQREYAQLERMILSGYVALARECIRGQLNRGKRLGRKMPLQVNVSIDFTHPSQLGRIGLQSKLHRMFKTVTARVLQSEWEPASIVLKN